MTKKDELEELCEMAKRIIKESGYITSNEDIENIINLIKNSPESKRFLER